MPDIVTMAKGIGNGVPLAAVVTNAANRRASSPSAFTSTPSAATRSCCAQGKAVLEVIEREKLQDNALKVGSHILAGLEKLKLKHNVIGDVRGRGLMIGVSWSRTGKPKSPARPSAPG